MYLFLEPSQHPDRRPYHSYCTVGKAEAQKMKEHARHYMSGEDSLVIKQTNIDELLSSYIFNKTCITIEHLALHSTPMLLL